MRRALLIMILVLSGRTLSGQCAVSGLSSGYCINSPATTLTVNPPGGTLSLSGGGAISNVFTPSLAGVGTHTLNYAYCSGTYSLESLTYTQIAYSPTFVTLGDNQMTASLPIGFTFRFFCNTFTDFYISSNGFITFSPLQSSGCCQGLSLPAAGVSNMIACAWTDLDPSQGGTIRYSLIGTAPSRALIVSFNCIFHKTSQAPVTSEIWLYESSNAIEISTVTKPVPTGSVQYNTTMGMQGDNNHFFVVPGRNGTSNWTATNELYRFVPGTDCSFNQTVTVLPIPTITASASKSLICLGEHLTLNASGAATYVWNGSSPGQTIVESPTTAGTYTVVGTDSAGCAGTGTVNVKVSACSGIPNTNSNEAPLFKIFPNPGSEVIIFQSDQALKVEIINQLGQKIKVLELSEANQFTATAPDLPPGVYVAETQNQGRRIKQKLLVVHPG